MKFSKMVKQEFEAKQLACTIKVRYWEDTIVNGVEEVAESPSIPCIIDGRWCPLIDIDTGIILNWEKGVTASVHYKVCDGGLYALVDDMGKIITSVAGYVPKMMYPKEDGFGDYIIMDIDENGRIDKWTPILGLFT